MADILLVQGAPLFDLDGAILAGGSVTFYLSGTTTLADIWADPEATVPLANPLDADAQGHIPAVFYTGANALRAVLRDADGARVRTIDPLPRGNVSTAGASQISFLPLPGNAATDVQEAIANNTERLEALDDDLGTAAYADLTTSATDATAGRVLKVGDVGLLGAVAPAISGAGALDELAAGGLYRVAVADVPTVTGPSGAASGSVLHLPYSSAANAAQLFANVATATRAWLRRRSSGAWSAWVELATSDNSLGFGQTIQDVADARTHDTAYQNTTGRPIVVYTRLASASGRSFQLSGDGTTWRTVATSAAGAELSISVIVPNGFYYRANGELDAGYFWRELR